MTRTADQTAALLAALFNPLMPRAPASARRRSEGFQAVRSSATHSGDRLQQTALEDFALHLVELDRGGYGMIAISTCRAPKRFSRIGT